MVKKSKLLAALDAHKGTDYRLGKQKILQKKAEKRKKRKEAEQSSKAKVDGVERESEIGAAVNGHTEKLGDYGDGWESDESRDGEEPIEVHCQFLFELYLLCAVINWSNMAYLV